MSRLNNAKSEKPENTSEPDDDVKVKYTLTDEEREALETVKNPKQPENVQNEVRNINSSARTYVLRTGKSGSFPISFPNGEILVVKFANGMCELDGRLSDLFHAEYMSNPVLRAKVSIVDNDVADKLAREYRKANGPVATPGLASAPLSPENKNAMIMDAQMRHMQRRASEGKNEEIVLPHEFKTELEQ